MQNLDKGKVIALNTLAITLLLYICFFTNHPSKIMVVVIFILTILLFLYQDILKRLFLRCSNVLYMKCNTNDAEALLSKIEKIDILRLYRKNCFILKCSIILDDYSDENFTKFINDFKESRLLRNQCCNLTFSTTLLQYFFLTNSYEQYHSLYKKIQSKAVSHVSLTAYNMKLISIMEAAFYEPTSQLLKQLNHLKREPHTKRDEIYIHLFSGYICGALMNQQTEADHFIKKAQQLSDTFLLSKNFQTVFIGSSNEKY